MPNFMKIRPVGAELFNADGRTDRHDETNGGFSNASKKVIFALEEDLKVQKGVTDV
jgi:hypothetical protein